MEICSRLLSGQNAIDPSKEGSDFLGKGGSVGGVECDDLTGPRCLDRSAVAQVEDIAGAWRGVDEEGGGGGVERQPADVAAGIDFDGE